MEKGDFTRILGGDYLFKTIGKEKVKIIKVFSLSPLFNSINSEIWAPEE